MNVAQAQIPRAVATVVADVIGSHYYNHRKLETLFVENGAPGEAPEGSCVTKCERWLQRCNDDPQVDAIAVLGRVIQRFMDHDAAMGEWASGQERVRRILAKNGLSYRTGGIILGATAKVPTRSLADILRSRDLTAVEIEYERALDNIEVDPGAAVAAASALVEALCKVYIEDENLSLPSNQTIKDLWKIVSKDLGLDTGTVADEDMVRVSSGLASVVDGVGALRTHASTAHGQGRTGYELKPRHARLAVHAAHTLAVFVLEMWDARKRAKSTGA